MDIFSVIIQDGLKLEIEKNEIYQFSDNLTFQFIKDNKYADYTLAAYIRYLGKVYGLEVKNDNTFNIDSRFLNKKEEFELSFSLTKSEKVVHLGAVIYRVKEAFGSTTSPLPEQKEIWTVLVEEKIDAYFQKNYQSKLDDFEKKYEEIKNSGGTGVSITVDTTLSSTSTNPVQNKVIKTELDKKAAKNEIPTNLSSLNEDETHQTVTADEKKKWDGKSDFDGDFNSLNNIPNIPDAVIVDAELNETSTNAIQNQAVAKELGKKIPKGGLKTVNGQSLEGDGNIQIEADVSLISRVEKTADDTTVSLDPNTLYVFPEMTSLSISLNTPKDTTIVNEYHFIFESGATATTFSLPSSLKVDAYSIDANKIYEVSILESICYIRGVASA